MFRALLPSTGGMTGDESGVKKSAEELDKLGKASAAGAESGGV